MDNYFEALKLSIDEIQGQNEKTIENLVKDAHKREYAKTIGAYTNVPRPDGLTQTQWQKILNNAKTTLIDPQKRQAHIDELLPTPVPTPDPVPVPKTDPVPKPDPEPEPKSDPVPTGDGMLLQQSIQRVAISGFSVAAIALVTRLIIQQFGISEWLTRTGFTDWERHWRWVEWFEWPWFEWKVYTLSAPASDLGFIIALASLGVGIFGYWKFFLKKKV